jgi:Acyl-CoA dehydrogenase, N-terminal domain/Acyl-CoA dehydrogenase, middle domain
MPMAGSTWPDYLAGVTVLRASGLAKRPTAFDERFRPATKALAPPDRTLPDRTAGRQARGAHRSHWGAWLAAQPCVPRNSAQSQDAVGSVIAGRDEFTYNPVRHEAREPRRAATYGARPMRFSFTDEQQEFRSVVRRFLEDKSPTTAVRRLMETDVGYDPEVWRSLTEGLGLTAIHVPEIYGGQGFGISELAITVEEMGRALFCAPYFASTVLATTAILKAGTDAQKQALLPDIAAGKTIAALAFTEENGRWDAGGVATTATPVGEKYRLDGIKSFVLDGHTADVIVVVARRPGSKDANGLSFFTVRGNAAGLQRCNLAAMDQTRKLARLTFSGVEAELLGEEGAAAGPLELTLDVAAICLAN